MFTWLTATGANLASWFYQTRILPCGHGLPDGLSTAAGYASNGMYWTSTQVLFGRSRPQAKVRIWFFLIGKIRLCSVVEPGVTTADISSLMHGTNSRAVHPWLRRRTSGLFANDPAFFIKPRNSQFS